VSLDAVMGHLAPGDEAMAAAAKDAAAALAKEIRSIGVISLSATAAEPVGCLPAASHVLVFSKKPDTWQSSCSGLTLQHGPPV